MISGEAMRALDMYGSLVRKVSLHDAYNLQITYKEVATKLAGSTARIHPAILRIDTSDLLRPNAENDIQQHCHYVQVTSCGLRGHG
jgi:hypothetical protein